MGAARRLFLFHAFGLVNGGMINAGARFEKLTHGGLLLRFGQRGFVVIHAKLRQRVVEIDLAFGSGNANQRIQQAFAAGVQVRAMGDISPCCDDHTMVHDHRRR